MSSAQDTNAAEVVAPSPRGGNPWLSQPTTTGAKPPPISILPELFPAVNWNARVNEQPARSVWAFQPGRLRSTGPEPGLTTLYDAFPSCDEDVIWTLNEEILFLPRAADHNGPPICRNPLEKMKHLETRTDIGAALILIELPHPNDDPQADATEDDASHDDTASYAFTIVSLPTTVGFETGQDQLFEDPAKANDDSTSCHLRISDHWAWTQDVLGFHVSADHQADADDFQTNRMVPIIASVHPSLRQALMDCNPADEPTWWNDNSQWILTGASGFPTDPGCVLPPALATYAIQGLMDNTQAYRSSKEEVFWTPLDEARSYKSQIPAFGTRMAMALEPTEKDPADYDAGHTFISGAIFLPHQHELPVGVLIDPSITTAAELCDALSAAVPDEYDADFSILQSPVTDAFLRAAADAPEKFAHLVCPVGDKVVIPDGWDIAHLDARLVKLLRHHQHRMILDSWRAEPITERVKRNIEKYFVTALTAYQTIRPSVSSVDAATDIFTMLPPATKAWFQHNGLKASRCFPTNIPFGPFDGYKPTPVKHSQDTVQLEQRSTAPISPERPNAEDRLRGLGFSPETQTAPIKRLSMARTTTQPRKPPPGGAQGKSAPKNLFGSNNTPNHPPKKAPPVITDLTSPANPKKPPARASAPNPNAQTTFSAITSGDQRSLLRGDTFDLPFLPRDHNAVSERDVPLIEMLRRDSKMISTDADRHLDIDKFDIGSGFLLDATQEFCAYFGATTPFDPRPWRTSYSDEQGTLLSLPDTWCIFPGRANKHKLTTSNGDQAMQELLREIPRTPALRDTNIAALSDYSIFKKIFTQSQFLPAHNPAANWKTWVAKSWWTTWHFIRPFVDSKLHSPPTVPFRGLPSAHLMAMIDLIQIIFSIMSDSPAYRFASQQFRRLDVGSSFRNCSILSGHLLFLRSHIDDMNFRVAWDDESFVNSRRQQFTVHLINHLAKLFDIFAAWRSAAFRARALQATLTFHHDPATTVPTGLEAIADCIFLAPDTHQSITGAHTTIQQELRDWRDHLSVAFAASDLCQRYKDTRWTIPPTLLEVANTKGTREPDPEKKKRDATKETKTAQAKKQKTEKGNDTSQLPEPTTARQGEFLFRLRDPTKTLGDVLKAARAPGDARSRPTPFIADPNNPDRTIVLCLHAFTEPTDNRHKGCYGFRSRKTNSWEECQKLHAFAASYRPTDAQCTDWRNWLQLGSVPDLLEVTDKGKQFFKVE